MSKNRKVVFHYGTIKNLFWLMDFNNDIHIRYSVELDHDVVPEIIEEAWEKTKRVFPIIDGVPEVVDENIVFFEAEGVNKAVKSKAPVTPGSETAAGRVVTATYFGNKISVSAFHTIVDGAGLTEISKTLLYFYLSAYSGDNEECENVQTVEGRDVNEYYHILSAEDLAGYKQQPLFLFPYRREFVEDEEMKALDDGSRVLGSLKFDSGEFIKICKQHGANPSAMLSNIIAKAFYRLHPDERRDIGLSYTVNDRKVLGLDKYISNCISIAIIDVEYEDVMNGGIDDQVKKFRKAMDYQRTDDYVKTFWNFEGTYGWNLIHTFATVTYMGKLDIGKYTKHIVNFEMPTNAINNYYMMELNGNFIFMMQLGKMTEKYMSTISDILSEMGLEVTINAEVHSIITDSDVAVL